MIRIGLLLLCLAPSALACELPADPASFYAEARAEERQLTRRALARADHVFVGKVVSIEYGPAPASPSDRESAVVVSISETLKGAAADVPSPLRAHLHDVVAGCFGNEAFEDDQVDVGQDYLFFVELAEIVVATPATADARRLGLQGQREVVLQAVKDAAAAIDALPEAFRGALAHGDEVGGAFRDAREFDGFDYEPVLRRAIAGDDDALRTLLDYTGRTTLMGAGAEDHAGLLLALLEHRGDAAFARVLAQVSPHAVWKTQGDLEYAGADRARFPLTFAVPGAE